MNLFNTILVMNRILEYIARVELIEYYKIIQSDYKNYLINLDIKAYFKRKVRY